MQRILMAFAIVLLLAGLAFADTVTWTAAVNTDFTNVGNWTGGVPAADGDTIDSTTATAPATNRPTEAGETYHFSITNAVTVTISNFLNGAAIGNVTVDNAGATVYCGGAITGNVVVTNGLFYPSNITISGTTNVAAAGTWTLGGTNTAVGEVTLAGALNLSSATVLDCSVPLRVTASTAAVNWGTTGDILGGFNAAGYTVAHTNTGAGSTLTCDVAGTLDLGTTTANGIVVDVRANTIVGASFACGTLTSAAGTPTLTGGGYTITVGAGGLVPGGMTLDAIDTTTFHFAYQGEAPWAWTVSTRRPRLSIAAGATATAAAAPAGSQYVNKLVNEGVLAMGNRVLAIFAPTANDFFSGSGTFTGTGVNLITFTPSRSNAALINFGSSALKTVASVDGAVLTATGGLTCGNLSVYGPATDTQWGGLTVVGPLTCADLTIGLAGTRSGKVTPGSGQVHTISGAIIVAGTGAANAFNPQGRVRLGGTFTGTGITVTPTYEGQIDCGGFGKVTAVTSTGRRLIVRSAVHSTTGIPLRGWQDDSCVNVMFRGRKTIGEPGIQ